MLLKNCGDALLDSKMCTQSHRLLDGTLNAVLFCERLSYVGTGLRRQRQSAQSLTRLRAESLYSFFSYLAS